MVTGLGSESLPFTARQISDISCQAMGCHCLFPSARTVIDIGGQFTKVVRITPQGRIADFLMSEKCATGSGRFLQVIARILQVRLEDIGPLSLRSQKPVEFSTNCAVFAESETISRIAEGARAEDILAGVHRAMAAKVAMLVKRVKMEPDVVLDRRRRRRCRFGPGRRRGPRPQDPRTGAASSLSRLWRRLSGGN